MSRIYEALRRAEAEKAAALAAGSGSAAVTNGAVPGSNSNGTASSVIDSTVAEEAWAEPLTDPAQHQPHMESASEFLPEPHANGLPVTPGAHASSLAEPAPPLAHLPAPVPQVSIVDLDKIASEPWTPALNHLPAVQERGRTVEQFRSLRSRMQEFRGATRLKSILVTSGLPQEGKSFIAVNLAISLARHKISNVLLIDGDMRRSSLHTVLGCPNDGPGLTEYLSGEATLQQILKRPAPNADGSPLPLGFTSLVFIGAGREADKAADLSGNHRFEELMATVAPLFDWVIVDSSPVNLVSDGVNLARACDGVLLIARGEVTKFETAQQAVAALESTRVLGFVLNAVNNSYAATGYYDYDSVPEKQAQKQK
jgi:capsular exopolysaccharide synthesis family protein